MHRIAIFITFVLPIQGWISSPFGMRTDPFTKQRAFHSGIDLSSRYAEAVKSVDRGEVAFAGKRSGYGRLVIVRHLDDTETYYGHLGKIFVEKGDKVVARQALGWSGMTGRSTGPHLHFEVRKEGRPVDPSKSFFKLQKRPLYYTHSPSTITKGEWIWLLPQKKTL